MIASDYQNTNRPLALIITLIFHGALVALFVLIIFHTPLPPYPEAGGGGGLEVNFGNTEAGKGNNNSEQLIPINTTTISNNNNDNYLTQDDENSASIKNNPDKVNKKNDNIVKINDPVVDQKGLYKKKNSGDGNTNTAGNQGKQTGDINSTSYTGDGGKGGGDGGGIGTGHGPGEGDGNGPGPGPRVKILNRQAKSIPKPNYNSKDEGVVVVDIWVDKQGNVTRATAGSRGTTTTSQNLWKLAVEAAKRSKFYAKPSAPEEQKGQITYNFINLN